MAPARWRWSAPRSNNNIATSPTITVASGATLDVSGITTPGGFQLVSSQTLAGEGTVIGATTLLGELSPGGKQRLAHWLR